MDKNPLVKNPQASVTPFSSLRFTQLSVLMAALMPKRDCWKRTAGSNQLVG